MQELEDAGMLASEQTPLPELPSADSVKDLRFLDAVLHESLRCYPPVPFGGGRALDQDVEVEGAVIPKGTMINMNVWSLHYSETAWGADAGQWRPERWLEARSCNACKRDANGHLRWVPFSQGKQNCLGQHLAMVRAPLATIACAFALVLQRCTRFCCHTCWRTIAPQSLTLACWCCMMHDEK